MGRSMMSKLTLASAVPFQASASGTLRSELNESMEPWGVAVLSFELQEVRMSDEISSCIKRERMLTLEAKAEQVKLEGEILRSHRAAEAQVQRRTMELEFECQRIQRLLAAGATMEYITAVDCWKTFADQGVPLVHPATLAAILSSNGSAGLQGLGLPNGSGAH
eukprot:NODE_2087_length_683_cov_181.835962_g1763_i0.p2 GENE.NODE_2087_length_683_cov_181.835962_g1763_i0~~NODE_2087_length_683_cov_181.835962_g1763_i0.p2  ORF type:complete len:164 (-),score=32.15 NODE_2087_length_683_cov_181.835962_g1763_i0:190-681(-)